MKKLALIAAALLAISTSSFARDSQWSLCKGRSVLFEEKNSPLVVNMFERRNDTGDGRATDFTMLFGNWDLKGSVDTTDTNAPQIELNGEGSKFNGKVTINNYGKSIDLLGTLDLDGMTTQIAMNLKCELLRD